MNSTGRIIIFVIPLLLAGCKFSYDTNNDTPPKPAPNPLAGCWDPNVKADIKQLAQQIALVSFEKSFPSSFTQEKVDQTKASFSLNVQGYLAFSYNRRSGSLVCGGDFGYTYKRPDGTVMNHYAGNLLRFNVYQGENGLVPTLDGEQQSILNILYETSDKARSSGDETGPSSAPAQSSDQGN